MLPLYATKAFQDICGQALRPGGLEITKKALQDFPLAKDSLVLDIGCGQGASLNYFKEYGLKALGLDLDFNFLKTQSIPKSPKAQRSESILGANSPPGAENIQKSQKTKITPGAESTLETQGIQETQETKRIQADALMPPFKDKIFDAIFLECVLSLLPDKKTCLGRYKKLLKDKGRLYISDIFLGSSCGDNEAKRADGSGSLKDYTKDMEAPKLSYKGQGQRNHEISCAQGAIPFTENIEILKKLGFKLIHTEDFSFHLKVLAAKMVFKYGSLEKFRESYLAESRLARGKDEAYKVNEEVSEELWINTDKCSCSKLEYKLIIAEK